jgi:YHS domain-containing protein
MAARDVGAVVTHMGSIDLRNVPAPVDIYRVEVADTAPEAGVDPVCQMRVPVDGPAAVTLEWGGSRIHFCGLPCVARFCAHPDFYPAVQKA